MLLQGGTLYSLPVQIPAAENQEARGRGVTRQNLICPAHWPAGTEGLEARTSRPPANAHRRRPIRRPRPRSHTYQSRCFLSSGLDSASHPVSAAITVCAVLACLAAADSV